MSDLLSQKTNFNNGAYRYRYGGTGLVADSTGKKGVDCSHLLYLMLKGAGYNVTYQDTSALQNSSNYTEVANADVQSGDILLWINTNSYGPHVSVLNHVGIVETYDSNSGRGQFFGSQSTHGPATTKFGDYAYSRYFPPPTKFLRIKPELKQDAQAAPAATPCPAATDQAMINFEYPFRMAGGKKFEVAEDIYKALEAETSGHYLIGSNDFWHGGIHISEQSAPQCRFVEPLRCIADGIVVAYRLNQDYLNSSFQDEASCLGLSYSNSFCLVRHEYKSPANSVTGKQNSLTFFSLYMHLLPSGRYAEGPSDEVNPKVKIAVSGFRAHSCLPTDPADEIYGIIPRGVELEILEEQLCGDIVYARGKILKGNIPHRNLGAEIWFGYKKNGDAIKNNAGKVLWQALLPPERTRPGYWQGQATATVTSPNGLPIYFAPQPLAQNSAAGARQGDMVLCTSSKIMFDTGKIFNLQMNGKFVRMAECSLVAGSGGLKGEGVLPSTFWACVEDVGSGKQVSWGAVEPTEFDKVLTVNTAIRAGDPIGYMALHETLRGPHGGKSSKYQVHLEIFSADAGINEFLKNEAGITVGKQYLSLAAGTMINPKAPATGGATLMESHAADLSKAAIWKDSAGVEWYEVNIKEKDGTKTGLVKKQGAVLVTQHDWEKIGFTVVKEDDENANGFLDPDKMPDFFQNLYREIDSQGNHDGSVSPEELTAALKNTDFRERWSRLIGYHPTEWKAASSSPKWAKLKDLLAESPAVLKHEQERIDKLIFWDELNLGLPSQVYHFHPIEAVKNFSSTGDFIDVGKFVLEYSGAHMSFGGDNAPLNAKSKSNLGKIARTINSYLASKNQVLTVYELSYMFATARVEAYYFPAQEYFSAAPEVGSDDYFNKYDPVRAGTAELRARAVSNGNTVEGDGIKYRGRGLVHLTWKNNYQKAKDKFVEDFVGSPDLAAEYEKAVPIMIWGMLEGIFSGQKLTTYINNNLKDYEGARRVINGSDRKSLIAGHALKFEEILKKTSVAPEVR